jgi:hypothetical protein
MTLTSADFQPIVDALTANAPILVGFIISLGAVMYVVNLVKRHVKR